jgi:protein-S-isoprenylcysteine O-methyltransferase Ste14
MSATESQRLDRYGRRGIAVSFAGLLLGVGALFVPAGTFAWANAWLFLGLTTAYTVVNTIVLARKSPRLLNERGKFVKEGTRVFDKVYVALYLPMGLATLIVSGLDRRFGWSHVPAWATVAGVVLLLPAFFVGMWAMTANPCFECTMRIQDDRGQQVITSGPYRLVRHPGYSALVLSTLTYPLILGSWWAFLPAGALAAVVVVRTALEDRMLRDEMPGYSEYVAKTRFRLIPLVW